VSRAEDDAWADLVARLEATESLPDGPDAASDGPDTLPDDAVPGSSADAFPPRPASPRPPTDPDHTASGSARPTSTPPTGRPPGAPDANTPPTGPRDWEAAEDDSDFVPPDPGPVLAGDPRLVIGWVLGAGLPLLLLALAIFLPGRVPAIVWVLLVAGSIGSWLYLVWRLPRERHDDGDDGARV